MSIEGVDYAFPPRPDIAALAAAGKRFACRYGGPGTWDKHLDAQEARALSAAGIAVVANAEGSATGLLNGWNIGADWALQADAHFQACGMPADRPIYLSVDFDVSSTQWLAVAQALRGAASVIGAERVGVYGGRRAVEWARRDGVAQWFWQTYAWSGGVWVPGNHIEQYQNGVALAGATLDLDRALVGDFGQWTTGTTEGTAHMLLIKTVDDPRVYVSDGHIYRHLSSEDALNAALAAGHQLVTVADMAQLEDLAGKPAGAALSDVELAALAAALAPLLGARLEERMEAAAERAVRAVMADAATPDASGAP